MTLYDKLKSSSQNNEVYLPQIFRVTNANDRQSLEEILNLHPDITIVDDLESQLRELVKSLYPAKKIKNEEYPGLIEKQLGGQTLKFYGVWVYYPWSKKLIHVLDENEFVEVRTNRNRYKITRKEQEVLKNKKIGIIGLSVGQSIALTLALERACGEIRLADFDTAELSNLNRIRTGVHNLGLKKTIIAAREIAEIDPFIRVKIFSEGITTQNIDRFFVDDQGKIDLLVEVCDGLDIKIKSRFKARELRIPVVMDTNDRGMLDIERFDLEPDREILHGLAQGLDPNGISDLTNEEKIPYILRMIGGESLSTRLKASMLEVEQSINTWPQLGSSVTLGGGLTTDVARRIFLDQLRTSGRYYVDLDQLISDHNPDTTCESFVSNIQNPYQPLEFEEIFNQAKNNARLDEVLALDQNMIDQLMETVRQAPSAGNNQPWKWIVYKHQFFLFHDKYRSYSWGDFDEIGSHASLGAALESLHIKALSLGIQSDIRMYPEHHNPYFVAAIAFEQLDESLLSNQEVQRLKEMAPFLKTRITNRKVGTKQVLPSAFYAEMRQVIEEIPGVHMQYIDDKRLVDLGEIISACDRERLLHAEGHEEFFNEIRWSAEEAKQTGDGIDLDLVDITNTEKVGFQVARDWKAISLLEEWNQGRAFQKMSRKGMAAASSLVLFTTHEYSKESFIKVGRAVMRAWLYATQKNIAVHPMLSPVFFFNRLKYGSKDEMSLRMQDELKKLRKEYEACFELKEGQEELFLMKLTVAEPPNGGTYRLPMHQIFQNNN